MSVVTKLTIVVGVLVLTTVVIVTVGYFQLGSLGYQLQKTRDVFNKETTACEQLETNFLASGRSLRTAVIAPQEEASRKAAAEARQSIQIATKHYQELKGILEAEKDTEALALLEQFATPWAEWNEAAREVLLLSGRNTITKARVILNKVYDRLNAQEAGFGELVRQAEKDAAKDADKRARTLVGLRGAYTDLLRHLYRHVDTPSAEGFDAYEDAIASRLREIEQSLASLAPAPEGPARQAQEQLIASLPALKKQAADIIALSREDTNNLAALKILGPIGQSGNACVDLLEKLATIFYARLEKQLQASIDSSTWAQRGMVLMPLIGITISVLMSFVIVRSIVDPVKQGLAVSERIAAGDLTARLNLDQNDEVGQLTQALDRTAEAFSTVVGEVRDVSGHLGQSSGDLSTVSNGLLAQSEEMATQANYVAASSEQMATNISTMAAAAEQMSMNVVSISSASEEISVNVGTISTASETAAQSVRGVAQAIQNATASFGEISGEASRGAEVAGQAQTMAGQATTTMRTLDKAASEISKVTEVIKTIALQTNLLALNATIEATAAGEAGKGFAVVANEIKELASQSGRAAEDIARKIEDVQGSTREAVNVIGQIAAIIDRISTASANIARAVDRESRSAQESSARLAEASRGVENIARSIAEVSKGATDMSRNASEVSRAANDVSRNASEAARGLRDVTSNIHGVSQATQDASENAQKVNAAAAALRTIAQELERLVSRFRVEAAA